MRHTASRTAQCVTRDAATSRFCFLTRNNYHSLAPRPTMGISLMGTVAFELSGNKEISDAYGNPEAHLYLIASRLIRPISRLGWPTLCQGIIHMAGRTGGLLFRYRGLILHDKAVCYFHHFTIEIYGYQISRWRKSAERNKLIAKYRPSRFIAEGNATATTTNEELALSMLSTQNLK